MITVQNESPFKTVNFSKFKALSSSNIISITGVTQGKSSYLGGFGITKPTGTLNYELDVEKRMQAEVLKRQIRIKQFFHDFDRLRKGFVGEAGVRSTLASQFVNRCIVQNLLGNPKHQVGRRRDLTAH